MPNSCRPLGRRYAKPRARRLFLELLEDRRLLSTARDDAFSVEVNNSITISRADILANDTCNSWTDDTGQQHDCMVSFPEPYTYTPPAGFIGTDSITYSIFDEPGGSCDSTNEDGTCDPDNWHGNDDDGSYGWSSATISIRVFDVVAATEDTFGAHVNVPRILDVLANDSTASGAPLTVTGYTQPAHGALSLDSGMLVYTPEADYLGPDSFTYTAANDGIDSR